MPGAITEAVSADDAGASPADPDPALAPPSRAAKSFLPSGQGDFKHFLDMLPLKEPSPEKVRTGPWTSGRAQAFLAKPASAEPVAGTPPVPRPRCVRRPQPGAIPPLPGPLTLTGPHAHPVPRPESSAEAKIVRNRELEKCEMWFGRCPAQAFLGEDVRQKPLHLHLLTRRRAHRVGPAPASGQALRSPVLQPEPSPDVPTAPAVWLPVL